MRHRFILIAVATIGVLAVAAIVAVIVFAAPSTPSTTLTQPTWTLTTLVLDGQEPPLSSSRPPTLRFGAHDGHVSGSDGCNSYSGSYALHGTQLTISGLMSTVIGCPDLIVRAQEGYYLRALPRVATYRLDGNTLTLSGDSGRVQLTFRAS